MQVATVFLKAANVQKCTVDALLFACWRTKVKDAQSRPSLTAEVQSPTVVVRCCPRRGCRCNTAEARYGHHDLVFTARQFSVGDCARLSAAWVLFFCLLTIMVVVVAAAPQASSRRRSKVRRVQGRVRDPEAHWLCAEGRHIALGGGGGIRTLRERR